MPSTEWLSKHRQIKIWVTEDEYWKFRAACLKLGISHTDALRPAIAQLIAAAPAD